jgi:hypothetical protein
MPGTFPIYFFVTDSGIKLLLVESRGARIAKGRNVDDIPLTLGFENSYARESGYLSGRAQHERPRSYGRSRSSAPYDEDIIRSRMDRDYITRADSRARDYSPGDYYRTFNYYDRSDLGTSERTRAHESVTFENITYGVVVIEENNNLGVGRTVFQADKVNRGAVIDRGYPFKQEVRANNAKI